MGALPRVRSNDVLLLHHLPTQRKWGMSLSLHKDFLMFFYHFFIRLFRDTHLLLFLSFCSLVSFYIAQKSDTVLFVAFRSDPYRNILGVAKDTSLGVSRRVDLKEDAWRRS